MNNQATSQAKWKQLRGKIRQRWGRLTDDILDRLRGSGLLPKQYSHAWVRVEQEIDRFFAVKGRGNGK